MHVRYINANRKIGLSGLMRVKNDEQTLAQSIDSCIDALDELIITYHECTDGSVQIIENKKLQYPDKILVIPYPYHVIGVGATEEEYEYAKTLPVGHPQLLASYYNNALQYVNYKYVMKIDADQIYFTRCLMALRNYIVEGVHQNRLSRLCGKFIDEVFCQRRGNKRIWSKYHLLHYLQYILVPLFKKQYVKFAISELLKGNGYLSLSGVNVLQYDNQWYSPSGCRIDNGSCWLFNGMGDHLIFEADEHTEYLPWDYISSFGKNVLIERFAYPEEKQRLLLGFYWFHLRPMKEPVYSQLVRYYKDHPKTLLPVNQLGRIRFYRLIEHLEKDDNYFLLKKTFFGFVYNLDKRAIIANCKVLLGNVLYVER